MKTSSVPCVFKHFYAAMFQVLAKPRMAKFNEVPSLINTAIGAFAGQLQMCDFLGWVITPIFLPIALEGGAKTAT